MIGGQVSKEKVKNMELGTELNGKILCEFGKCIFEQIRFLFCRYEQSPS